jgi:hypothetical protein
MVLSQPVASCLVQAANVPRVIVPEDSTAFWTFVLAIATIFLATVGCFGLRSIAISRTDMRDRNTRESAVLTIRLCSELRGELLPKFVSILESLNARGIRFFVTDAAEVSFHATEEVRKINAAIAWLKQIEKDPGFMRTVLDFMNHLETWSMSLTHDPAPANENFAFDPCSSVYCQMVMVMYPMLLTQRRLNPASGPFQNTIILFQNWYRRKSRQQLLEQLERQADGPRLPPLIGTWRMPVIRALLHSYT